MGQNNETEKNKKVVKDTGDSYLADVDLILVDMLAHNT
jgi:hypothetical protein